MDNIKRVGCVWGLAVAVGIGVAMAQNPAFASADSGKGPSSRESSSTSTAPRHHKKVVDVSAVKPSPRGAVRKPAAVSVPAKPAADPDFITSSHRIFGLFSVTSAADPDDNHYVAFVLRTPFFTDVLTSGTDPQNTLGFGTAGTGVAGHTVNTLIGPFGNVSFGVPVTDPFAPLFTSLVRAGF